METLLTCDISHHSLTLTLDNKLYLAPLKKDIEVRKFRSCNAGLNDLD